MKAVFLDFDSVHPSDLDLTPLENCVSDLQRYGTTTPDQLHGRIKDAEVIISNKVVIDQDALAHCTKLKLICVAATGFNNVDVNAAKHNGVTVCNVRNYATESVVEHVFSLMLALTRHLIPYDEEAKSALWQHSPFFCLLHRPIIELSSLKLGIIGFGELGRGVAKKAEDFGMQVLVADSFSGKQDDLRVPLDTIYAEADVISLHCPLSDKTRDLIGMAELEKMKPTAFLINTARGGIVNEFDLAEALVKGKIAGAGFDVLSVEPPQADNPLLNPSIPNLILTPHIAWSGRNARQTMINMIAENITAYVSGKPINAVN